MKNSMKTLFASFAIAGSLLIMSCEKDKHTLPDMNFKTGAGYTSSDGNFSVGQTITVGVDAKKTEDDLNTFNVSKAYDNASSTTTVSNEYIGKGEKSGFSRDITITLRNQAGTEKYVFTVTDKDGNIKSLTLNLNVQ